MFPAAIRREAIGFRRRGYSLNEINRLLGISQSTASVWLKGIKLSRQAKQRIKLLSDTGRQKSIVVNKRRRSLENANIQRTVEGYFSKGIQVESKIACALLYWGEGTKYEGNNAVSFMNADPEMVRYFLRVFRNSFSVDEKRLRALVHLHGYHNAEKQVRFWSSLTKIPVNQFNRSHLKKNTGKSRRENYQGCISIRYSDVRVYKELMFIIKKLAEVEDSDMKRA